MSEDKGLKQAKLKLTNHFSVKEMACPHCGVCLMREDFMENLEAFRVVLDRPVHVTSGYRCLDHNTAIKGARFSRHMKGDAADISTAGLTADQIQELQTLALRFFVNAVIGLGFLHVDDGPKRKWRYR